MKKIIFLTILSMSYFLNRQCLHAQIIDYSYSHFSMVDGLPSNTVYSIASDKNGLLLFGTDAGFVEFDGNHFKTYTTNDGLPSNDIFMIFCDHQNRKWLRTMSNEVCFIKNGKVHNKFNDSLIYKMKIQNEVLCFFEDNDNNVWVIGSLSELKIVKGNQIIANPMLDKDIVKLADKDSIFQLKGVFDFMYKHNRDRLKETNEYDINSSVIVGDTCWFLENNITKLEILNTTMKKRITHFGHVWFMKKLGNFIYRTSNNGLVRYTSNNADNIDTLLKGNVVSDCSIDCFGNIWISTLDKGVFKVNSTKNLIIRKPKNSDNNNYFSVLKTKDKIYLGDNKGTLNFLNTKTFLLEKELAFNYIAKSNFRLLKLFNYSKNKLVIVSDVGILELNKKSNAVKRISMLSAKNCIYIDSTLYALENGFIRCLKSSVYDTVLFNPSRRFYALNKINNELVIGAEDGLFMLKNKQLVRYKLNEFLPNRIMDILILDSMMVLATIDKGLYFVKNHSIIQKVNLNNGLSSNNCLKLQLVGQNIFISTNNGMNIYDLNNNQIQKIFESDGLVSNNIQDFFIENDTLFAATDQGLSIFLLPKFYSKPTFSIYSLPTIVGKDTSWSRDSIFNCRTDSKFILNLVSLTFNTKGNVDYHYRIVEKDKGFIITKNQQLTFNFDRPGHYTIEAYAKDRNGVNSNTIKIEVNVKAYLWETIWFKFLLFLFSIFCIYLFIKKREKRLQRNENEKRRNTKKLHALELAVWQSKINPHFLFNTLSSIASIIKMKQNDTALEYIHSFSYVLRQTIQHSRKPLLLIKDEIKYIEEYLNMEKLKREGEFNFSIKYDMIDTLDLYMPSLILQPVIENSLKHAIKSRKDGKISIKFEIVNQFLQITVSDNGDCMKKYDQPNNEKDYQSMGIELVYSKIKIIENIYQIVIKFEYEHTDKINKKGATSRFTIPIITKDNLNESYNN